MKKEYKCWKNYKGTNCQKKKGFRSNGTVGLGQNI
jgi:hypothetical protein